MQVEMSFERGYCRPECVKCSEVCPTGAIQRITVENKSSTQIGQATWIKQNCVVFTDEAECDSCAWHCPVGAITMVDIHPDDAKDNSNNANNNSDKPDNRKFPMINTERCIGCGACEYLCPSRPYSAIYVEGQNMHRMV
jgi:formate hydrogenlyase subunit 6/NADH:ubiquinone oxidoreductase subunit I